MENTVAAPRRWSIVAQCDLELLKRTKSGRSLSPVTAPVCFILLAGCGAAPGIVDSQEADATPPLMSHGQPADTLDGASLERRIDGLIRDWPSIREAPRNPFRFGSAESGRQGTLPQVTVPIAPAGVADRDAAGTLGATDAITPDADIAALRFIGIVEAPESAVRVAILTDGHDVYHGRVDDVIAGRYRILAIGEKSVEIERAQDGEHRVLMRNGF